MGGGFSHRSGLDDLILVKENHIEAAGGLTNALPRLRDLVVPGHLVEVEVTGLDHAMAVAETGVSLLLLDNMQPQEMADVVVALTAQLGPGRAAARSERQHRQGHHRSRRCHRRGLRLLRVADPCDL